MTPKTIAVTITTPAGITTSYPTLRSAAKACGLCYTSMRVAKMRGNKTIKGHAVTFSE